MNSELSKALADCLSDMERGAGVEDCLKRHPGLATELRPHLETSLRDERRPPGPAIGVSLGTRGRHAMQAALASPPAPFSPLTAARLAPAWATAAAAVVAVIVLLGGAAGTSAALGGPDVAGDTVGGVVGVFNDQDDGAVNDSDDGAVADLNEGLRGERPLRPRHHRQPRMGTRTAATATKPTTTMRTIPDRDRGTTALTIATTIAWRNRPRRLRRRRMPTMRMRTVVTVTTPTTTTRTIRDRARETTSADDCAEDPTPDPSESPEATPEADEDANRGHGNDADHDDEDNPGQGQGNHGTGNNGSDNGPDNGNGNSAATATGPGTGWWQPKQAGQGRLAGS